MYCIKFVVNIVCSIEYNIEYRVIVAPIFLKRYNLNATTSRSCEKINNIVVGCHLQFLKLHIRHSLHLLDTASIYLALKL